MHLRQQVGRPGRPKRPRSPKPSLLSVSIPLPDSHGCGADVRRTHATPCWRWVARRFAEAHRPRRRLITPTTSSAIPAPKRSTATRTAPPPTPSRSCAGPPAATPRPRPHRPHRPTRNPKRDIPHPLGRAQRPLPRHSPQAPPPPRRRRAHLELQPARHRRRRRPHHPHLHPRTRHKISRSHGPARQLGSHPGSRASLARHRRVDPSLVGCYSDRPGSQQREAVARRRSARPDTHFGQHHVA
jgi:hypothetical protein